jgi:hypothetical protein
MLAQCIGALPRDIGPRSSYVKKPDGRAWRITLTGDWSGIVIETRSVEDPAKIASWPLDGVALCEAALCVEEVWLKLRARVAERKGFVLLAGTFERARGFWMKALYHLWKTPGQEGRSYSFPTWENYALFPGGWDDPEIVRVREGVDEDWFNERFAGQPVKPVSLVFRQFDPLVHVQEAVMFRPHPGTYQWRRGRLGFKLDPGLSRDSARWPVELAIDPGNADYAILAIQRTEDEQGRPLVLVIDEVWGRNKDTAQLIEMCRKRPWWNWVSRDYPGTIDTAAKARTGSTPIRQLWLQLAGLPLRVRFIRVQYGIDKLRGFLRDYGMASAQDEDAEPDWARVLVAPRCGNLISEFQMMRFPDRQDPSEWTEPQRGFDHGIKALWYFLVDRYPGRMDGVAVPQSAQLVVA